MKYSKHVSLFFSLFFCQGLRSMCISKPPACWWQWARSKGITLVNTHCWADLTGDTVVWRDPKKKKWSRKRGKKQKNRQQSRPQVCAGDPACDSAVMWSGTEQAAEPGLAVQASPVHWCDMMPKRQKAVSTKRPFFIFTLGLYRSFSHMFWHSVSNSLPASSFCQSYRPCHAATHFPSLFNSFLSIPPCSHLSFHHPSPNELWVCHAAQSSGPGRGFQQVSNG